MSVDPQWFPLRPPNWLERVEALFAHPAPTPPPKGTPMPPIPAEQIAQVPAAPNGLVAALEQAGQEMLAAIEAKAEPIAEALMNDLIGKLPFGTILEPLADAVLKSLEAKLTAHNAAS